MYDCTFDDSGYRSVVVKRELREFNGDLTQKHDGPADPHYCFEYFCSRFSCDIHLTIHTTPFNKHKSTRKQPREFPWTFSLPIHKREQPSPPSCHSGPGGGPRFNKGAYTLGKMVWGKGWEELLDMLELQRDREAEASVDSSAPHIDAFGSGEAEHAVRKSKT